MKQRRNKGFTLAEMLIVVAIIGILAGVSFIAVQNYQRSMHQLEYDGTAKEIFIAAQNHLTMADSQGLVKNNSSTGAKASGYTDLEGKSKGDVYYFVVPGDNPDILSLMLPQFSIDETVRAGSYMIIYQRSTATVLDVFYSPLTGRYSHRYESGNYNLLVNMRGEANKSARRNVRDFDGAIVGWYGGDSGIPRVSFETPSLLVENAEKLRVIVNNPKANTEESVVDKLILKLYIKGVTSTNEVAIPLFANGLPGTTYGINMSADKRTFEIVLDDITGDYTNHFAQLFPTLLPGEDLEIWAEASSNSALSNIAPIKPKDNLVITNSLFADPDDDLTDTEIEGSNISGGMAGIANIRHLENLHQNVSSYSPDKQALNGKKVTVNKAVQISDLSWKEFKDNTDGEDTRISYGASGAEKTEKGCYYPVSPNYQLNYDGQKNKVSDVSVNIASDAGMFGKIDVSGSSVSNLDLLDFSINGSTSAGALAGSISNCTVTNVLAHNSISKTTNKEKLSENIKASGYAGGLIGNLSSGGTIVNCAAALWVESSGSSAGGLIGSLSGDRVITSYAGGHTENGQYSNTTFNVTGSTAGGLIGTMTSGTVSNSYSTCSASGTTAGGFVGNGSGGRITNCYCTGLVLKPSDSTDKHGAFAGEWSASALSCQYFDIINEHGDAANGFTSLTALGGNRTNSNITAFDTSAEEYEKFCGSNWDSATPYDGILNGYYSGKFNLRTVAQIGKDPKTKTTDMSSYVSTHYGDWPAPEAFVVNKGNSSGNSLNPTP